MLRSYTGFVWGVVTKADDPLKMGRVKVYVPGLFEPETSQWCLPLGWPGAGRSGSGSRYPAGVGQTVALFLEQGDMHAPPAYLPGPYGYEQGKDIQPGATTAAKDTEKIATIWETSGIRVYVSEDESKHKVVIETKETNEEDRARVEVNGNDGAGKAATVTIQGRTSVTIKSDGVVDISGSRVQIQGRIVASTTQKQI